MAFDLPRIPRLAVLLRRDDDGAEHYRLGAYVWTLRGDEWSVYGLWAAWPKDEEKQVSYTWDEARKHMDALDIAAAEEFEWDYQDADPDDLYAAVEAIGYSWDEDRGIWTYEG